MPNSLLWIGLVAVWLFVLVPMLVTKRPRIRQTTDAALATRVLHRGDDEPIAPRGPAAGHRSDPNWRPSRDHTHGHPAEDRMDTDLEDRPGTDTDEDFSSDDDFAHARRPGQAPARDFVPQRRGRGGFDPHADAVASAQRYDARQRAVLALLIAAILSAALALIVSSVMWWICGAATAALVGYLFYLRRQVQLEQEIRRRRLARLHRSRLGVESRSDEELRLVPERLRRRGAVVLEIDDEDPDFDHLGYYVDDSGYIDPGYEEPRYGEPRYGEHGHDEPSRNYFVPRAAGQ
ncbi:gephyrin-like molybdotransferase receptor GlpR [Rhodococcus sp. (in: high G+C Gram-positive bacteria)]|uniref:divisome protein SepX/GlpR n=1 Tax=Rhodococcus sp. TaxID=1831 RepID=UPI00388D736D